MSRLIAFMGSDPERLQAVLAEHRDLLLTALPPEPGETVASFGVGFYQGGEVLLQRRPRITAGPIDAAEALKDLRTDTLLAEVQIAVPGKLAKNENTPPFRFRSWLMVHHSPPGAALSLGKNGAADALREEILRQLPDFLRRNIRGQGPCEHLFHLFLVSLHEAGRGHLEDANLPPELSLRALQQALGRLDESVRRIGTGADAGALQIGVSNGRSLVVANRAGADGAGLWVRRLSTLAGADHHEHLRGALVFSGPLPAGREPAGLEAVPTGQALLMGRDLDPRTLPL